MKTYSKKAGMGNYAFSCKMHIITVNDEGNKWRLYYEKCYGISIKEMYFYGNRRF